MNLRISNLVRIGAAIICVATGAVYAQSGTIQSAVEAKISETGEEVYPSPDDVVGTLDFAKHQAQQTADRCSELAAQIEQAGEDVLKSECVVQAQGDCEAFQELLSERIELLEQVKADAQLFKYHAGVLKELTENAKASQLETADCVGKNFKGGNSKVESQISEDVPRNVEAARRSASGSAGISPSDSSFVPFIPTPASGVT